MYAPLHLDLLIFSFSVFCTTYVNKYVIGNGGFTSKHVLIRRLERFGVMPCGVSRYTGEVK